MMMMMIMMMIHNYTQLSSHLHCLVLLVLKIVPNTRSIGKSWQINLINWDKSKLIYHGTGQRLCSLPSSLRVAGCNISTLEYIHYLVSLRAARWVLTGHVHSVVRACRPNFPLWAPTHPLHCSLPREVTNTIACIVLSAQFGLLWQSIGLVIDGARV